MSNIIDSYVHSLLPVFGGAVTKNYVLMNELLLYLKEYMLSDMDYCNCTEIAKDFSMITGGFKNFGIFSVYMTKSGIKKPCLGIKVMSRGFVREFQYHTFFSLNGFVFDPEYAMYPVRLEQYLTEICSLNSNSTGYVVAVPGEVSAL